jgi:hypothetical protein
LFLLLIFKTQPVVLCAELMPLLSILGRLIPTRRTSREATKDQDTHHGGVRRAVVTVFACGRVFLTCWWAVTLRGATIWCLQLSLGWLSVGHQELRVLLLLLQHQKLRTGLSWTGHRIRRLRTAVRRARTTQTRQLSGFKFKLWHNLPLKFWQICRRQCGVRKYKTKSKNTMLPHNRRPVCRHRKQRRRCAELWCV